MLKNDIINVYVCVGRGVEEEERKAGKEKEKKKERIHKDWIGHRGLRSFCPLLSVV